MDHYKLYRPDRVSPRLNADWIVHLVEVLSAIGFVLIIMYLVR